MHLIYVNARLGGAVNSLCRNTRCGVYSEDCNGARRINCSLIATHRDGTKKGLLFQVCTHCRLSGAGMIDTIEVKLPPQGSCRLTHMNALRDRNWILGLNEPGCTHLCIPFNSLVTLHSTLSGITCITCHLVRGPIAGIMPDRKA